MARFLRSKVESSGDVPGSLVFIGNQKIEQTIIQVTTFNSTQFEELDIEEIRETQRFIASDTITWIRIYGLHDTAQLKTLGEIFQIHPLALEDILNTGQRPKFEEYDENLFIVLKMLRFDPESEIIQGDQLSIILGNNYLISFHEKPADIFHPVRERLRKHRGRIRECGADYLAYAMLDTVVDNYIIAIEAIGSNTEDLEEAVLTDPSQETLNQITNYKREINYLRKVIRPTRELVINLAKSDTNIFREQTLPFLKDLQDLVSQASEALDSYREMLSDQLNIYNTTVGNKLNEIMKVLTIFAAIFIPLTFIAGIYGTNFDYIPELRYKYSYFILWGIMIAVAGVMLRFFRRKGWM
ncbi:magnesium/cobalt transporter CorA [Desulfopila inferna]|uniref:magnesium/cobalt transporter CorA n=1 Tax=Desulfopila inferna TaxID=468528 RepID=UPI0019669488|nr:magnesium/cobalt transporter CorA [Desulfopila inferna]MBM9603354.1 magnesium/cobalt transporter CorA [Desulfopila inferna]